MSLPGAGGAGENFRRYQQNRDQVKRKSRFQSKKSIAEIRYEYLKKGADAPKDDKKATAEQLETIRQKLQADRKRHQVKALIISLMVCAVAAGFIIDYIVSIDERRGEEVSEEVVVPLSSEEREKKYQFYMADGQKWLDDLHWSNAIFQYEKALEMYPNDFPAQHRLAIAYGLQCQFEQKNCKKRRSVLAALVTNDVSDQLFAGWLDGFLKSLPPDTVPKTPKSRLR